MKKKYVYLVKIYLFSFLLLLVALVVSGCASLPEMHTIPMQYAKSGQYEEAYNYLESNKNTLYDTKDTVVYDLDEGVLLHYTGNYSQSTQQLSNAEKLIYDLYTKSISQEISSFIVNDTLLDYPGEDYEDIYTNLFMSLNYYHQNKTDDAIVEINRAVNKIQALSSKHEAELVRARKAGNIKDQISASTEFHNSALGQYLAMIYHRSVGDMDAAYSDQHLLADAFLTQKKLYPFPEPASVKKELSIPADKGRLNILAFSGLSPVKYENRIQLGHDYVIAVPVMKSQPSPVHWMKVTVKNTENGETADAALEEIESIENIAMDTFRIRSQIIYNKAVARCITKGTTTVASRSIGDRLEDSSDSNMAAIGSMLKLFSSVNSLSNQLSEQADLRISRYFPARADIGGITLEPGVYNVSVDFYDRKNGTIIASCSFHSVTVAAGGTAFVEATCLGDQ